MFPHQLVGVTIRRVRREKEQHQLSAQRFNKGLGLLGAMCGPAIDDQEDLALRSDQKPLQKFDEHIRIHAAGFFDHKTHMTFGSYRRDQTDAVSGSRRLDDRRFTLLSPRAPRVMIRTHVRRVSKINVRTLHLRHFLDLRIFSLQPSLHERLIAFESAMQRFLTGDTQLRQQPAHGHHAQDNLESGLDDLCHHLARPQRKFKFELQRILLRHRVVNPFQFLVVQLLVDDQKEVSPSGRPSHPGDNSPATQTSYDWLCPATALQPSVARQTGRSEPPVPSELPASCDPTGARRLLSCRNRVRTYQPCQGKYAVTYVPINTENAQGDWDAGRAPRAADRPDRPQGWDNISASPRETNS